jgi:hypothetical protein
MKFHFISDGSIPIPPINGWGALERVVCAYKDELEKLGHEVFISNTLDDFQVLKDYRRFKPHVVHNHLGKHWEPFSLMSPEQKIFTNHGGGFKYSIPFYQNLVPYLKNSKAFVLTDLEKKFWDSYGFESVIQPNGVFCHDFNFKSKPQFSESLFLGKIMSLKRQSFFQKNNLNVVYVGNKEDQSFDYSDSRYLGSWNYQQVLSNLTNYSNLVLLSLDELQPLVCLEAMSAGLGLVLSEAATQSLDTSLPWITVIPENKISDIDFINAEIAINKKISLENRDQIRLEALKFDWSNIVKRYIQNL